VATAGVPLRGVVEVEATKPFKANRVALRMYGKEKTNISGPARVQDSCERATVQAGAERRFFAVALDLRGPDWAPGTMNPAGSYRFPFEIDLPGSLPPSTSNLTARFQSLTGNKEGFRVQYKLVASIPRKFKKVDWTSMETKATTEIVEVRAAPQPAAPHPCLIQPVVQDIKGILHTKGAVTFGARIEDSELAPGETLRVTLAGRNHSTAEIKKVGIELVEELVWEASFREGQSKSLLRRAAEGAHWIYNECFGEGNKTYVARDATFEQSSETVLCKLDNVDLPGVDQAKKTRADVRASAKEKTATYVQDYPEIYSQLKGSANSVSLKIPLEAKMGYSGRLIKVNHFLRISLQTGLFVSDAHLIIPIRITAPPEAPKRLHSGAAQEQQDRIEAYDTSSQASNDSHEPAIDPSAKASDKFQAPLTKTSDEMIFVGKEAQCMIGKKPVAEWILPNEILQEKKVPSMNNLFRFMKESINACDLLVRRTKDAAWAEFFGAISAEDFGRIVAWVPSDFDRPRAAAVLAPFLNQAQGMDCAYAAAAVRNTGTWNRSTLVEKLLPLCTDLAESSAVILEELNGWEEMVTSEAFVKTTGAPVV